MRADCVRLSERRIPHAGPNGLAIRSGVTVVTILTQPTSGSLIPIQSLAMKSGGWWTYPSSDLATLMRRMAERRDAEAFRKVMRRSLPGRGRRPP